jgi:kinesin family protein 11
LRLTLDSARKAKVLGTNADAATKFGADVQVLSKDLRKGLSKIHAAHGEMGVQLKSELSTHAKRGQEVSYPIFVDSHS